MEIIERDDLEEKLQNMLDDDALSSLTPYTLTPHTNAPLPQLRDPLYVSTTPFTSPSSSNSALTCLSLSPWL